VVLAAHGVLDSTTYRPLRDQIIKAALDAPRAVIVEVTDLAVPAPSAWAVFTSARWHVNRWPQVPIVLVCEHEAGRSAIARNGISRYLPLYPDIDSAVDGIHRHGSPRVRQRAYTELSANVVSLRRGRDLITEWLTAWSCAELIPVAKVVVTTLVENVLQHTVSAPGLRVEYNSETVTVAVSDTSRAPASAREDWAAEDPPSGLRILSALTRIWGNAPTPSGKTVWAVIGPENRL
jgi:hypothetical protein